MINIGTILLSAPLMTGGVDTVNAHDLIMAVRDDMNDTIDPDYIIYNEAPVSNPPNPNPNLI